MFYFYYYYYYDYTLVASLVYLDYFLNTTLGLLEIVFLGLDLTTTTGESVVYRNLWIITALDFWSWLFWSTPLDSTHFRFKLDLTGPTPCGFWGEVKTETNLVLFHAILVDFWIGDDGEAGGWYRVDVGSNCRKAILSSKTVVGDDGRGIPFSTICNIYSLEIVLFSFVFSLVIAASSASLVALACTFLAMDWTGGARGCNLGRLGNSFNKEALFDGVLDVSSRRERSSCCFFWISWSAFFFSARDSDWMDLIRTF